MDEDDLGRHLKKLLYEVATGLSRANSWSDDDDVCSPAGRNGIASSIKLTVKPCGLVDRYIRVHSSATFKNLFKLYRGISPPGGWAKTAGTWSWLLTSSVEVKNAWIFISSAVGPNSEVIVYWQKGCGLVWRTSDLCLSQHFPFLYPLNHAVLIRHMKKWGQISLYFTKDTSLVTKTK
jgi:hypothetical protein